MKDNKAVFLSLDLETGREYCGVVQLSVEAFRIVAGTNEVSREASCFNKYVKPPDGAVWSQHATDVHGLHAEHNSIISAYLIAVVWQKFECFLDKMMISVAFLLHGMANLVTWNDFIDWHKVQTLLLTCPLRSSISSIQ